MAINTQLQAFSCEYVEPYTGRPYGFMVHAANKKACKLVLKNLDLRAEICGKENGKGDQHRIHTGRSRARKAL